MGGVRAVRTRDAGDAARSLFDRIGDFLSDQRLTPDPANYAFAYHVLGEPDGPLARAVATLTESGARVTRNDVEALLAEPEQGVSSSTAERLVARTQIQVDGFSDMVHAMRVETAGFGRDLAASAAAIRRTQDASDTPGVMLDEVAQITAAMIERVHSAESRLESATREASDLRRKLEEARDNARRDPLTELPNRRAFEEAFTAQEIAGARICIAICDVDHFKSVNDRFGHAVGDRVLKAIGEALAQTCARHMVARYGGEEFVVLFTGMSVAAARATLESARLSVAAKRYRLRESDEPLGEITFSAGVAEHVRGESRQELFQRADALLYSAKNAGRNCVRG